MDVPTLTPGLLDAFLARVESYGIPGTADSLQPGLSDEEMDRFTAPIGLRLPEEARVLWRWRNGGTPRSDLYASSRLLPLADAVASYHEQMDMAADAAEDGIDPGGWWPPTFLPLIDRQSLLAIDCADSSASRSPVHVMADPRLASPRGRQPGNVLSGWS